MPGHLVVNDLTDTVHAAAADVSSRSILSALQLVFSSPAVTCVGGGGSGADADPYVDGADATADWQGAGAGGLIASNQASCSDYTSGAAQALGQIGYQLRGGSGKVGSVNPDSGIWPAAFHASADV